MASRKIVICGAGFLGAYVARELALRSSQNVVHLASRSPSALHQSLSSTIHASLTREPSKVDITQPSTLSAAFKDAHTVISLVGILHGSPSEFERIQWKGAENVAREARKAGAGLVHVSAIGADPSSSIPYFRTKGLGEQAVFEAHPDATVIRPSLVFGPGDGFFARFATLSRFLPFLPVFGGGTTRFQPVFAGDIARLVEYCTREDKDGTGNALLRGKIVEAGGPEVFTYKEMMQLVLKYTNRTRPVISLPYEIGMVQGLVMELLPPNLLTITRDQVRQLRIDNIVGAGGELSEKGKGRVSEIPFEEWMVRHDERGLGPTGVEIVLPSYLGQPRP